MESEFLLVWVPTAPIHLAALKEVPFSFVKSEMLGKIVGSRQGHASATSRSKAWESSGLQIGLEFSQDLAAALTLPLLIMWPWGSF